MRISSCTPFRTKLLVIDDDPSIAQWIEVILDGRRYQIDSTHTAAAALQYLEETCPDVVLVDEILPDGSGLELMRKLRQQYARLPMLLMSVSRNSQTDIEAIKAGAVDCVRKPLEITVVRSAIAAADPGRPPAPRQQSTVIDEAVWSAGSLVGESVRMQRVFKAIGQAACCLQPTLICGPTGSGKETLARALHAATFNNDTISLSYCPAGDATSGTWHQVWDVAVNTGESGTLVLQEVDQLSLTAQTQLLHRIETLSREQACKSGKSQPGYRVVCTSSGDLSSAVSAGRFRADLFYAIAVHRMTLPALRERLEDLPQLIQRFASDGTDSAIHAADVRSRLTPSVLRMFSAYSWPGNLDELCAFVKGCSGLHGPLQWLTLRLEELTAEQSAAHTSATFPQMSLRDDGAEITALVTHWQEFVTEQIQLGTEDLYATAIAEAESKFLQLLLGHTHGNQAQAARILGITRASLRKKIRSLHLAVG